MVCAILSVGWCIYTRSLAANQKELPLNILNTYVCVCASSIFMYAKLLKYKFQFVEVLELFQILLAMS